MKKILILLCLPLLFATCKKEEDNTPTNNTGNTSIYTYVPDDNFEAYLEANNMGNGITNDDYVTTANINTVTLLTLPQCYNISDLTGIEDFTALTTLNCYFNQLTSLDVSQNTALTNLRCNDNQLTSLDVSQNTALTNLECNDNQLSSLDLSGATALTWLSCWDNQLTSLDVSNNTALEYLDCSGCNDLTCLDVSQNTVLTELDCVYGSLEQLNTKNGNWANMVVSATHNDLMCVEVDNV